MYNFSTSLIIYKIYLLFNFKGTQHKFSHKSSYAPFLMIYALVLQYGAFRGSLGLNCNVVVCKSVIYIYIYVALLVVSIFERKCKKRSSKKPIIRTTYVYLYVYYKYIEVTVMHTSARTEV